jgi:hypothetical protein
VLSWTGLGEGTGPQVEDQMIRACVEVGDESGSFSVVVCAENIQQAVRVVADLYPGCAVSVKFPLDPETFFVENPAVEAARLALVTPERTEGWVRPERG